MKFLKLIPILLIFFGNFPYKNLVHAEVKNPKDYKVLSNDNKKLSISNVEYYLTQGDKFIKNGDFVTIPSDCCLAISVRRRLLNGGSRLGHSEGCFQKNFIKRALNST